MASLQTDTSFDKKASSGAANRDILDLSRVVVRSDHELKRLMEKVPDFKIRADKCSSSSLLDQVVSLDGDGVTTLESVAPYPFADPIPASMREVDIRELGRVDINWRMLTTARPKNRTEEDIFTRFVQLEKLQYETVKWENDEDLLRERRGGSMSNGRRHAGAIPRGRSRGGALTTGAANRGKGSSRTAVTEIRLQTCRDCGEEFCGGTSCKKYLYDDHARTLNPPSVDVIFKVGTSTNNTTSKTRQQKVVVVKTGAGSRVGSRDQPNSNSTPTATATATEPSSNQLVVSGETKRASVREPTSGSCASKLKHNHRVSTVGRSSAVDDGSQSQCKAKVSVASDRHGVHKLKRGGTKKR